MRLREELPTRNIDPNSQDTSNANSNIIAAFKKPVTEEALREATRRGKTPHKRPLQQQHPTHARLKTVKKRTMTYALLKDHALLKATIAQKHQSPPGKAMRPTTKICCLVAYPSGSRREVGHRAIHAARQRADDVVGAAQ